jgi:putative pyruvate formate lyase activating enzyme
VFLAAKNGLTLPVVYNTSGYDRVESLKLLEPVIDIYMPDFKFWDADIAQATCRAPEYPQVARKALLEMVRQVGDLSVNSRGVATRGLLVRHLLLPGDLAGTEEILRFIAQRVSPHTYVNIMPQYRPCGRAAEIPALSKGIDSKAYGNALAGAGDAGLTRLDPPRWVFRPGGGSR